MSDDKKDNNPGDNGFIVLGPDLPNGGRAALRVTKDGGWVGEMHKEGSVTRVVTKPLGNSILEVVDETPIGKPSKVNSKAYQDGWDRIFGGKKEVDNA